MQKRSNHLPPELNRTTPACQADLPNDIQNGGTPTAHSRGWHVNCHQNSRHGSPKQDEQKPAGGDTEVLRKSQPRHSNSAWRDSYPAFPTQRCATSRETDDPGSDARHVRYSGPGGCKAHPCTYSSVRGAVSRVRCPGPCCPGMRHSCHPRDNRQTVRTVRTAGMNQKVDRKGYFQQPVRLLN
jgi:hypothetical protein